MNRNRISSRLISDINLQRFAGEAVDHNTQTTGSAGMSVEMKTYYQSRLIDNAEPNLIHDQFGDKYPIPANGGKTTEFRAYDSLPKALKPLTEGVTPKGGSLNVTHILATVSQFGHYVTISDMLKLTAIDNNIVQALKVLGSQAGRTLDTVTRDVLAGGSNVIYAGGKFLRKNLESTDRLTPELVFRAATQLRAQNAPTINGDYVGIVHPYAAFDLMRSEEWIEAHKYASPEEIYKGEIGKIGGVRFVQSTEAKIWKDSTCPNDIALSYKGAKTFANVLIDGVAAGSDDEVKVAIADGKNVTADSGDLDSVVTVTGGVSSVFSTLILGANAYGVTEVTGGGLQTIIKQLGDGEDPLNQRATVGWKATKTAERLVEQNMVRIEALSDYSVTAEAN